jgi:hypothetical protein
MRPVASGIRVMVERPLKITFAEMHDSDVRGIPVYLLGPQVQPLCRLMADHGPDDVRPSDIEPRYVCSVCATQGAEVRPNANWNVRGTIGGMGCR